MNALFEFECPSTKLIPQVKFGSNQCGRTLRGILISYSLFTHFCFQIQRAFKFKHMRSFQWFLLFWGRPPCSSLHECHFTERIVQVITYVATYRRRPELKNHLIFTPFR
jgi:hypothetical protein